MAGASQSRADSNSFPFIVGGEGFIKDNEILLTDGSRTVVLAQYTLMSQVASSGKWVPWLNANLGGTTGTQYPMGFLMNPGGVSAAALVAGDVTGAQILYAGKGCQLDLSQIVFDKGSTGAGTPNTLAAVPTVPTNLALQAEQILAMKGFVFVSTVAIDNLEN
ncbi:MAG TPA: hypothetical protein VJ248_05455 [Candidatus Udaeobacter sp.]|nr:hypothetical protein [Candidatus Udaeobacter sp.]